MLEPNKMYMDKEIEKAIRHFKRVIAGLKYLDKASISDDSPYLKDYIKVRNERNRRRLQASRIAVEALEEQTEKTKGCEHCREWDNRCGANYCPMCGRKLEVRNEQG